jgi:DNA-binding transcriptional LysR family regulator
LITGNDPRPIRSPEESLGARLLERSTGIGGIRLTPTRAGAACGEQRALAAEGRLFADQGDRETPYRLGQRAVLDHVARPPARRVFGPHPVMGAAIGGAWLALGRAPLIDPELRSGRLVRLFPDLSRPASWRYVQRRGPSRRHRMLDPLIEFLLADAAAPASLAAPLS